MTCQQVLAQRELVDLDAAVSAHVDLAGTPHASPLARIFLREQLRGRLDDDTLHTAELLTTELVTNVVLHARTALHVGVTWDEHHLVVTVQDDDPAALRERDDRLSTYGLEAAGRGMLIIASLADDFGWACLDGRAGKVMWFALVISPSVRVPDQRAGDAPADIEQTGCKEDEVASH